jgi:hypothetical protein
MSASSYRRSRAAALDQVNRLPGGPEWPSDLLRGIPVRLGRALLPRLEIRQEHPLQVISKRITDAQHSLKIVAPGAGHKLALVGGMGDLVQVAADAPKLADGALESQ